MYNSMMTNHTLVTTPQLAEHLVDPDWAIIDCRFSLMDTERGRRDYKQAHIQGAVYAHLDEDLSGPIVGGKTGRHPLPDIDTLARTLSDFGIDANVQVVAYDDFGGAIAARLWWLLRWLGHDAVAVLDGGWPHWHSEDRMRHAGSESRETRVFIPHPRPNLLCSADDVLAICDDTPTIKLFDSRSAERYRGENETIDPVAGHIAGALSASYAENLDADGLFRSPQELRTRFRSLFGETAVEQSTFYCGSGVTAAHNLLALVHAGLGDARLYAGSWSEWINDPDRPIATGSEV